MELQLADCPLTIIGNVFDGGLVAGITTLVVLIGTPPQSQLSALSQSLSAANPVQVRKPDSITDGTTFTVIPLVFNGFGSQPFPLVTEQRN